MNKAIIVGLAFALAACLPITQPLSWNPNSDAAEAEYEHYLRPGAAALVGQAFLVQRGGGVVKAAGRTVTLDPATSVGNEWWGKAGRSWENRAVMPPSPGFVKTRRTTVADAEGRFRFADLAPGTYFVRTEVTWFIGGYYGDQGGLVGQSVEVRDGQVREVILNHFPE